jgi:hypothetical protein
VLFWKNCGKCGWHEIGILQRKGKKERKKERNKERKKERRKGVKKER